jgi:hypothetical protein
MTRHTKGEIYVNIPPNQNASIFSTMSEKGEILNVTARKVNALREEQLDIEYFVAGDKIYKQLKDGKYRALVLQSRRDEYKHYFLRRIDKKKLTVNVKKLDLLTYENFNDNKMSLSSLAPSLELKLQKRKSTHLDNQSANTNTNSIVVNNFLDPMVLTPRSRSRSPIEVPPSRPPTPIERNFSPIDEQFKNEAPTLSPSTSIIEKFKDLLIEYQTELLLNDWELICNIAERGKNIVMKEQHLINIIKCLEPEVNDVEIDKEPVQLNCVKCSCKNPLYYKITAITLNKTRDFTTSNFKVILQKQYNISLDFCI